MADLSYHLYDTIPLGTAADTTFTLFQVAQGGDSTHTKQFTNSRGAGQLPQNEAFRIRKLSVVQWGQVAEADIPLLYDGCYVEIRYSDEVIFSSPLAVLIDNNAYSGVLAQAAAANRPLVGRTGNGYLMNPTFDIIGGTAFRVDVFQDNALSAAENLWFIMEGILTRK